MAQPVSALISSALSHVISMPCPPLLSSCDAVCAVPHVSTALNTAPSLTFGQLLQKWRVIKSGRPSLGRSKQEIPFVANSVQFSEYLPFVNRDAECKEVVDTACEQFASLYAPLHITTRSAGSPAATTPSSPTTTSSDTADSSHSTSSLSSSSSSSSSSSCISPPPPQIVAWTSSADQYDKVYKVYTSGGAPGIGTTSSGPNSCRSLRVVHPVSAHAPCLSVFG